MTDISSIYARSGIASAIASLGQASSSQGKENPLLRGIILRIRDAALPYEKKKELIATVWNIFKEAGDGSGALNAETIKKLYALVDVMELTEHYHLKPGELESHQRKIDDLVAFYFEQDRAAERNAPVYSNSGASAIDITV